MPYVVLNRLYIYICQHQSRIVFFVELWTINWLRVIQWKHDIKLVNRQCKPVFVKCVAIMAFSIVPDEHNPFRTCRSIISEKPEHAGDNVVSKIY